MQALAHYQRLIGRCHEIGLEFFYGLMKDSPPLSGKRAWPHTSFRPAMPSQTGAPITPACWRKAQITLLLPN
jgi:hypothetical protein